MKLRIVRLLHDENYYHNEVRQPPGGSYSSREDKGLFNKSSLKKKGGD
ncbi:MAG: hypothetical protein Q7J27_00095 [Syntrophales bacterium]|nr:hypothetical protein [Syntrophales bacterium]